MSQVITISNITKVGNAQYRIEFSANFTLTDLFYEISAQGGSWNSPIALTTFTSPQIITVPNSVNFNVRLSSNYTAPIPPETGFLMINSNDKFLINDTDSLKYTN